MGITIFGTVVEENFLRLAGGLVLLIITNIVLGSMNAMFTKQFNFLACLQGFAKGVIVTLCSCSLYFVGLLNPDVVAIEVGGEELTILTAINMTMLGGYYLYSKQVFVKLAIMLKSGTLEVPDSLTSDDEDDPTDDSIMTSTCQDISAEEVSQ